MTQSSIGCASRFIDSIHDGIQRYYLQKKIFSPQNIAKSKKLVCVKGRIKIELAFMNGFEGL